MPGVKMLLQVAQQQVTPFGMVVFAEPVFPRVYMWSTSSKEPSVIGPWWFVPVPDVIGPEGILEMSSFDEYSVLYPVQFLHYISLFAYTV